jgi:hypothetical protein
LAKVRKINGYRPLAELKYYTQCSFGLLQLELPVNFSLMAEIFVASHRLQALDEKSIADTNAIASAAVDRAALAGKQAAASNERSRLLEREVEKQRSKNLALEEEIAPRRIKPPHCDDIGSSVKSFPGLTVHVESYSMDPDGAVLGWQISGCLVSAHSVYVDMELSSILPAGLFGFGVFVSGSSDAVVSAIKGALKRADVDVVDVFPPNQVPSRPVATTNPAATVVVGIKPPIDMK